MAALTPPAGEGRHGLSPQILADLRQIFARFPEVQRVLIYGSRARGDFHPGSDIDLAVEAPEMTPARFAALWAALEDSPIAFRIDLVRLDELRNPQLEGEIRRHGKPLYP